MHLTLLWTLPLLVWTHAERPLDSAQAVHDFVLDGDYASWSGWAEVRESDMADGGARVYLNPVLERSLAQHAQTHPVGSAAVRELYETDLVTLRGWSVAVKVAESDSPQDWFFFEVLSAHATVAPTVAARGASGCVSCHQGGVDFIQSMGVHR